MACTIITPEIINLAKEWGKKPSVVNAIMSAYQTQTQSQEYPSLDILKAFHEERMKMEMAIKLEQIQEDEIARLHASYPNSQTLQYRIKYLSKLFSESVSSFLSDEQEKISQYINLEKSKDKPNKKWIKEWEDRLAFLDSFKGRQSIIQNIGLNEIFDNIRETIESKLKQAQISNDQYKIDEYQKILDNFPALLGEMSLELEMTEHVRISVDYKDYHNGSKIEKQINGNVDITSDEQTIDENSNEDDENGDRVTGNDGWGFKSRLLDPYTTASKRTKEILSNIKRVDENGKFVRDDLGNYVTLNPEYAHVVLLNCLSKIVSPDQFSIKDKNGKYIFPALDNAIAKYPWLKQIKNALQADANSGGNLIGVFYSDLRQDFIPYSAQMYDRKEGKYITKYLNVDTAADSLLKSVEDNFNNGIILNKDHSIYTSNSEINKNNIDENITRCNFLLNTLSQGFTEDQFEKIKKDSAYVFRALGIDVTENNIGVLLSNKGFDALKTSLENANTILNGLKKKNKNINLVEVYKDRYAEIAENIGIIRELDIVASFREGTKTYYSYSTPNYIDTMIKTFKNDDLREKYLEDEFGQYKWFKDENGYRSEWLRRLADDGQIGDNMRKKFRTKDLLHIRGVEYMKWNGNLITEGFVREYFSSLDRNYTWYNMPIFADSPVCKFIRAPRFVSDSNGSFYDKLIPLFREVVLQEMYRIDLVKKRKENNAPEIQNFDKRGQKFCFFPELNNYILDGRSFYEVAEELKNTGKLDELNKLIDRSIMYIMNDNFITFFNATGGRSEINPLIRTLKDAGVIDKSLENNNPLVKQQLEDALKEYFWNQAYATTQIIQLTVTDLAYYKDDVDFQKRFKEVYASGRKLNTNTPKYGKKFRKTIYIADSEITSSSFMNIKSVLDSAVEKGFIQDYDRDAILNKFKKVNVADAQAYITPKSLRSILDMLGKWDENMERAFNNFSDPNGQWNIEDFNTIWQTIKPFIYTQIPKPDGLGGMLKVGHQNKNSEYVLLAAYQMIASSTGQSKQLRAIHKFMDDNDIDCVQFQSGVKAGGEGIININYSRTKLDEYFKKNPLKGEKETFDNLKDHLDKQLENGEISQEEYNKIFDDLRPDEKEIIDILESEIKIGNTENPTTVHSIPYRDYMIAQETPEHLIDHESIFGSQLRNLIIADLPENFKTIIHGKEFGKNDIIKLYNSLITENILRSFDKVRHNFDNIYEFQKALLNIVEGNPKYGRDMKSALQIVEQTNPITGQKEHVFNIPFSCPSMANKLQEVVNSMFKNHVTKQYIKGGNAILVSDYGLTDKLKIEYEGTGENKRVKCIQCYLPAYSREFYNAFMTKRTDANGKVYYELDINKVPEDLRKIVGYRIPTEDKYSMAPLKIMGFLPQQNGSSIMLPADITSLAGSDFDVDKMFLMIPEFEKYDVIDWHRLKKDLLHNDKTKVLGERKIDIILDEIKNGSSFSENTPEMAIFDYYQTNKEYYTNTVIKKINYDLTKSPSKNSTSARNNMIIDIVYNILTNDKIAHKFLNPGNFDTIKVQGRINDILNSIPTSTDPSKDTSLKANFKKFLNITSDDQLIEEIIKISDNNINQLKNNELHKYKNALDLLDNFFKNYRTEMSQLTPLTYIYNHQQNMAGAQLIGIYANNTSMQAKYQHTQLALKDGYTFQINGKVIKSLHDSVSQDGFRISKNCAEFQAASVDGVKDPVLRKLMQTPDNAKITGLMLRAGLSIQEISLLFNQPRIRGLVEAGVGLDAQSLMLNIKALVEIYTERGGAFSGNEYLHHNFTTKELLENIVKSNSRDTLKNQILALQLFKQIVYVADKLQDLTGISRADSPNGAIHHSLAGMKVQIASVQACNNSKTRYDNPFEGLEGIPKNGLISADMDINAMRGVLELQDLPILQAFYSFGIEAASGLIGKYFPQINAATDTALNIIFGNASQSMLSNRNKVIATSIVHKFYKDLTTFLLSKTKLFGDQTKILQKYNGKWSRDDVERDKRTLYIFTDNTDRDSGSGEISDNSWYASKYGTGHHYPKQTTAIIRGLDNARPISTQRWYHDDKKGKEGRWNDTDFNDFKAVIDDEFEEIYKAWDSGQYTRIMFPTGDGLFNSPISDISKQRTPLLYNYLQSKVKELQQRVDPKSENDDTRSYEEKRDYYLNDFPSMFQNIKEKEEFKNIGLISKLEVKNNTIIFDRVGGLRAPAKNLFMSDMDSLLYMSDESRKLALDLFMYSFYKDGLHFGPTSIGIFFSPKFYNCFPEVMNTLRFIDYILNSDTKLQENLLEQFYANNAMKYDGLVNEIASGEEPELKIEEKNEGNEIYVPQKISFNRTTLDGSDYKYVIYMVAEKDENGKSIDVRRLYKLKYVSTKTSRAVYEKVPTFESDILYNANKSVSDLKKFDDKIESKEEEETEFSKKAKMLQSMQETAPSNTTEGSNTSNSLTQAELSAKASEIASNTDSSIFETIDGSDLDQFSGFDIDAAAIAAANADIDAMIAELEGFGGNINPSIMDRYSQDGGEDTLDEPMCEK